MAAPTMFILFIKTIFRLQDFSKILTKTTQTTGQNCKPAIGTPYP